MERWDCSHMFIERKLREDPTFPPCTRLGDGPKAARRWEIEDIEEYERSRVTKRSA
jgi:hypothetical protein